MSASVQVMNLIQLYTHLEIAIYIVEIVWLKAVYQVILVITCEIDRQSFI